MEIPLGLTRSDFVLSLFSEIVSFPPHRPLLLVLVLWAEVACRDINRQAMLASGGILPLGAAGLEQAGGSRQAASQLAPWIS